MSNLSNYRIALENRELVDNELAEQSTLIAAHGRRSRALEALANLHEFAMHKTECGYPAKSATTKLSAHNKFGTCSIREVYHSVVSQLGAEHQLTVELLLRDFYSHIAFFFLHVFRSSFYPKYDALDWDNATQKFDVWCAGETWFLIVDAGMRELNASGFMHNRVRMIVASFLVKDLILIGVSGILREILQILTEFLTTGTGSGVPRRGATLSHIFAFSIRGCNRDDMTKTVAT